MALTEETYTQALIAAVSQRPVLYNVRLADYKNKVANISGPVVQMVTPVSRSEQEGRGVQSRPAGDAEARLH